MTVDERKLKQWIKQRRKIVKQKIRMDLRDLRKEIRVGDIGFAQITCRSIIEWLEELYLLDLIERELLKGEE